MSDSGDVAVARALTTWFRRHGRVLPWRVRGRSSRRDGYRTLVSELMLQQTQVSRVLAHYEAFVARFPDVRTLAHAREQSVLAAWSGLGYYRRAKHLHGAAKMIHHEHQGRVPCDVASLGRLPGVGAYTAGAVASLAFDRPEAIVDGNVSRVLQRLNGRRESAADAGAWAWAAADALVRSACAVGLSPGDLNEALMELGATVCTPRGPRCGACPVRDRCVARASGSQEDIPLPKPTSPRRRLHCASVVAVDGRGRVLIEQRGPDGLWADMWQAPTLERLDRPPTRSELAEYVLGRAADAGMLRRAGGFEHQTTHRRVRFVVYTARSVPAGDGRVLKSSRALSAIPISNAQRKVLAMAGVG
ncbi:MAG: A/G-specific adenine glycosylase [Planctomycetes bacterium]|nr:A/G-specific adenine glycosylase [Planctomycetota bacterium]